MRLTLLLATAAAFLLVPVAAASAATGTIKIEGTGSGEVIPIPGEEEAAGAPEINCKYTSPGPATGTCVTTAFSEEGINILKVRGVAAPGSELVGWDVLKGTVLENLCEDKGEGTAIGREQCGAFTFGPGAIEIKAIFDAEPKDNVHIAIEGSGAGSVLGTGSAAEQGEPPVNCSYVSPGPAEGVCNTKAGLIFGFEAVQVEAVPVLGSEFTGWTVEEGFPLSGGCSEETENPLEPTCGIVIVEEGEEIKIKATFTAEPPPGPELTVTKEGTGSGTVVSSPAGIECGATCTAAFEESTVVTLTASPAAGSLFTSWKGCETVEGRKCKVTMSAAKEVKAKFSSAFDVTVKKAAGNTGLGGISGVTCDASCTSATASFLVGKAATLKPKASKGSEFTGWTGCPEVVEVVNCKATSAATVEAKFTAIPKLSLTVNKAGGGQGTVKSKPSSINCGATCTTQTSSFQEGIEVELTASVTAGKGSSFGGWSVGAGTCTGTTSPCKVTMSSAKSLTAEFK